MWRLLQDFFPLFILARRKPWIGSSSVSVHVSVRSNHPHIFLQLILHNSYQPNIFYDSMLKEFSCSESWKKKNYFIGYSSSPAGWGHTWLTLDYVWSVMSCIVSAEVAWYFWFVYHFGRQGGGNSISWAGPWSGWTYFCYSPLAAISTV